MGTKAQLSPDGYEIHFATNHLGHAAVLHHLLPTLLATTRLPGADVRVISLTSLAFEFHPKEGIAFEELDRGSTFRRSLPGLGGWTRYGQSKLANILYASALAKRHPEILSVSLHPGVVETPIVETMGLVNRTLLYVAQWMQGNKVLTPEEGSWNTVWAACVAERSEVRNGGFYMPVGVDGWDSVLDQTARDEKLADQLWEWTLQALEKAR
jgi:NAD(P)-dependent dehydrogenase (short-subunit alcohol dehydrogenase family)